MNTIEPPNDSIKLEIRRPSGGWRRIFTTEYVEELRPYAEVIAMIDNKSPRDYTLYIHEADAVYRSKQGKTCWEIESEDPTIKDLQQQIKLIRKLKGINHENTR
jgi:hypothetical protein